MARTNVTRKNTHGTPVIIKTKLDEHDAALDALGDGATEQISVAGAIATLGHTDIALSGTKAYTLAVGTKAGQRKTVRCFSAASTPAGTLAGAFLNNGVAATSIAFSAVTFFLNLVWNGTAWVIVYNVSGTVT